ncbi:hypothetical protein R8Z50_11390 [Longispora sp. K20-0274]|uniref:hypothetical protein n=1 Tax=Longispora sp. K20-0274 TaxID=3088255 RepID=UPI00399AC6BF
METEIPAARLEGLRRSRTAGLTPGPKSKVPPAVVDRIVAERGTDPELPLTGWRTIAAGLNADGVATAQGAPAWSPATVRAVWLRATTGYARGSSMATITVVAQQSDTQRSAS